jgi:ribonuclease HII
MTKLAARYPGYGWEQNVGYATRRHMQGLRERGLTPFHRTGYAPVRTFILQPTTLDDLIDQLDNANPDAIVPLEEALPALA